MFGSSGGGGGCGGVGGLGLCGRGLHRAGGPSNSVRLGSGEVRGCLRVLLFDMTRVMVRSCSRVLVVVRERARLGRLRLDGLIGILSGFRSELHPTRYINANCISST